LAQSFLVARSLGEIPSIVNAKNMTPNRRFEFHNRSQLFIGTHNETLANLAMRVRNPDCSAIGNHG